MLTKTQIDWLCYKYGKLKPYACNFKGETDDDSFLKADGDELPFVHLNLKLAHTLKNGMASGGADHLVFSTFGLRQYQNAASISWQSLYGTNYQYSNKVFKVSCGNQEIHIEDEGGLIGEIILPLIDEALRFNLLGGIWQLKGQDQPETTIDWDEVVALIRDKGDADNDSKLKKDEMSNWVTLAFISGLLEPEYVKGAYIDEMLAKTNTPKNTTIEKPILESREIRPSMTQSTQFPLPLATQNNQTKRGWGLIDVNNTNDEDVLWDIPGITKDNLSTFFAERRRRGGFAKGEEIVDALGLAPHFADKIEKVVEFKEYTGPIGTDTVGPRGRVVDD